MSKRNNRSTRAAKQAISLAVTAPQVIAHRTLQMAQAAGSTPAPRLQREMWTMGAEKVTAFSQSWVAMWMETARIQQQMATAALTALWFPWMKSLPGPRAMQTQLRNAAFDIAAKGVAPVQRVAAENLRRLSRVK